MMTNEFQEKYEHLSQKDVILHLLQVANHAATRKDVKDDISKAEANLGTRIDDLATNLGARIDGVESSVHARIDDLATNLGARIDGVDARIDRVEVRIDLLASKLDRFQWLMITGIVALFFKDYIMALFQ